jgi:hypothetical protein
MLPTATGLNRSPPFILSPTSRTLSADNGALLALYYFMLKTYDETSWAAFIDRWLPDPHREIRQKSGRERHYNTETRRGRDRSGFRRGHSRKRVAENYRIQTCRRNVKHLYKHGGLGRFQNWPDHDHRRGVKQSETHEKVRDDIADSDIQQIVDAVNAQLTVPYVTLNFGEQEEYPKIDLFKPDEKTLGRSLWRRKNGGRRA